MDGDIDMASLGVRAEGERVRARVAQELRVAMKACGASRVAALRSLAAAVDAEIEVLEQYVDWP